MAFPVIDANVLTETQRIDATAEAEAGIIQCLANLFCDSDEGLVYMLKNLPVTTLDLKLQRADLVKETLCSYACKEFAIADVINSLACKISVDNNLFEEDCCCHCDC